MLLPLIVRTLEKQIAVDAHTADWEKRAANVALYRRYVDGDHDARLTPTQRSALQLARYGDAFCDNYMDVVIRTMANRLRVTSIDADMPAASAWAADVLANNRFDGLQLAIHEHTLIDGDTFIMVSFDNASGRAVLSHELAFDGISGIIPIYRSSASSELACVVKVWDETIYEERQLNVVRVNVYYPDRIERYIRRNTGLEPFGSQPVSPWTARDGSPLGIPIIPLRNRPRHNYGISEIEKVIPLQDALNSILHDLLMCSRLTGFQMRAAIGFEPPTALTPGDWIVVGKEGLDSNQQVDVRTLAGGDITPLLEAARWLTREIGNVTSTAAPELFASDNLSGEAFRRREINLIGKCIAFQVTIGNAWEDVLALAWRVEAAYGHHTPPAYKRFYTRWADAALRDERQIIENALKIADRITPQEFLRLIAPAFGWDEAKLAALREHEQGERVGEVH